MPNGILSKDYLSLPQKSSMEAQSKKSKTQSRVVSARKRDASLQLENTLNYKEGFFMNHQMPFLRESCNPPPLRGRRRSNSLSKLPLVKRSGDMSPILPAIKEDADKLAGLAADEHKTHNVWLRKIRQLYDELD